MITEHSIRIVSSTCMCRLP